MLALHRYGTFTLSYGGYIGDFVEVVGGAPTTYSVNIGEVYLTKVSGSVSNIHAISRGELTEVAGSIYRVCTDLNMEFTHPKYHWQLLQMRQSIQPLLATKIIRRFQFINQIASLGCMTLNPAENTITTTWSDGVANDLRKDHNNKGVSRGDLIRLGDPHWRCVPCSECSHSHSENWQRFFRAGMISATGSGKVDPR